MKQATRIEISSVGTLYFCGEDIFFVKLEDIPREKELLQLTKELIEKKEITDPDRRIINEYILNKAPKIESTKLSLFFFNPRAKDEGGSFLREIVSLYEEYSLKGDPLAMLYLNLLDKNNSFVKNYPHLSLFSIEKEMYSMSLQFSDIPTIEGVNIATSSARRTSGYFPKEFWFVGITKETI